MDILKNLDKMFRLLKEDENYHISPNFVADFARNREIELTSEMVVFISNHFEMPSECPHCSTTELLCGYPKQCCTINDEEE